MPPGPDTLGGPRWRGPDRDVWASAADGLTDDHPGSVDAPSEAGDVVPDDSNILHPIRLSPDPGMFAGSKSVRMSSDDLSGVIDGKTAVAQATWKVSQINHSTAGRPKERAADLRRCHARKSHGDIGVVHAQNATRIVAGV